MSIHLTCIDAVPSATDAILDRLPFSIGRGDEADVCIRDTWASRVHCRIIARNGRLWLEDLSSINGTLVNGVQVQNSEVRSGDQITVGITTFRVAYSRVPATRESIQSDPLFAGS
jgi:pSer/pThr/pTyr-binding forkhead associated (FHA) protein